MLLSQLSHLLDLSLAEQAGGTELAEAERFLADDIDADRLGEPDGLRDPRVEGP